MMKQKEQLRYIAVLPSVITLMNGFFGFLAIMMASYAGLRWQFPMLNVRSFSYSETAVLMVYMGMLADMFDGMVARSAGVTSPFGAQLDSLCDAVSFGVAPALIAFKMFSAELVEMRASGFAQASVMGRWALFGAIIYAMCALVRLARFNVETDADAASHMSFTGLPSPAAAGFIVSLVLFHEGFLPSIAARFSSHADFAYGLERIIFWSIPFALCAMGLLMVSRIAYPHLANRLFKGKQPFHILIVVIFVVMFVIWNFHIAILLGFSAFVVYGLACWLMEKLKRTGGGAGDSGDSASGDGDSTSGDGDSANG